MPKRHRKPHFRTVTLSVVVNTEDKEDVMTSLSNWFYSSYIGMYRLRVKHHAPTVREAKAAREATSRNFDPAKLI